VGFKEEGGTAMKELKKSIWTGFLWLIPIGALILSGRVSAAPPEFRVNSNTSGDQIYSAAAMDARGNFIKGDVGSKLH